MTGYTLIQPSQSPARTPDGRSPTLSTRHFRVGLDIVSTGPAIFWEPLFRRAFFPTIAKIGAILACALWRTYWAPASNRRTLVQAREEELFLESYLAASKHTHSVVNSNLIFILKWWIGTVLPNRIIIQLYAPSTINSGQLKSMMLLLIPTIFRHHYRASRRPWVVGDYNVPYIFQSYYK